jgi:hypothetical protein
MSRPRRDLAGGDIVDFRARHFAMGSLMRPLARRAVIGRVGAWLGVLALVIQSALPLADAAFHAALTTAGDDHVVRLAASPAAPDDAIASVSKPAPAHLDHACPICQFISALGSFSPPAAARTAVPAPVVRVAAWPTAPPAARSTATAAAQPRAPPALI